MTDSSPVSSSPPPDPDAQPPARTVVRPSSPVAWAVALALAAMVGTLLFIGGYLAAGARGSGSCAAPTEAFVAFCQAYSRLKDEFVDQLNDEALAEGAI